MYIYIYIHTHTHNPNIISWSMILLVYLLFGICQSIGWIPPNLLPFNHMVYSGFGTILFTFYLAYHTKLIVGGKHSKYRMNEKDYVFGAMALYMDIINIFLNILRMIGEDKDRGK
jgi:FtsH-binding integral membrane protein